MSRDRRFDAAFASALAAHGLGLLILGLMPRNHGQVATVASRQLEVGVLSLALEPDAQRASAAVSADPDAPSPRARSVNAARQPGRRHGSRSAIDAAGSTTATAVATTAPTSSETNGSAPVDHGPSVSDEVVASEAGASRHPLSRAQLGLGEGNYTAALAEQSPVTTEMRARLAESERLERSMRQDAAQRDGKLGLGPEGPILAKLEELALRNQGDLTGYATVTARLHANGSIDLQLLGTSSDDFAWRRLLERAKADLLVQHLKPPSGSRGIDLEIRITSRVQLPSGADPGFGVKLFGIPLKKGEGKRSPGLEVLSTVPTAKCDEAERDPSLRCRLDWPILKLAGDLTDLSGKRSRIVSARVTKRTVL